MATNNILQRLTNKSPQRERTPDELNRDSTYTLFFFLISFALGLIPILITGSTTAFLCSLCCLSVGGIVGFLFGIPKVIQSDVIPVNNPDPATKGNNRSEKPVNSGQSANPYRQRVNTNLEDISDWLTKIIVGLGLVHLSKIWTKLKSIASVLMASLPDNNIAFSMALLLYFGIVGFVSGYLATRLFLQPAFARADKAAMNSENRLRVAIENVVDSDINEAPTPQQIQGAESVAEAALSTGLATIRQKVTNLADEYDVIRDTLTSGYVRTEKMQAVVNGLRALGIAALPLLPELIHSEFPGQRLAAIVILQLKPDAMYLDWLAQRIREDKPFAGYQAALALLNAARNLHISHSAQVAKAISDAKNSGDFKLDPDTDRFRTLSDAESELSRRLAAN